MSEFEKWYKNSGNAWSFQLGATNEAKFKVGWKAALEYIKAECIKMDEYHTVHCDVYCSCYNNVLDIIEEELEE